MLLEERPDSPGLNEKADQDATYAVLAALLDELVAAKMSASGYRVVLDTLARALRTHATSEAVPLDWMAGRLQLSRNAVGLAYQSAVAAGVLRRTLVAARGAPTRTTLHGRALRLLTPAGRSHLTAVSEGSRVAPTRALAHASRARVDHVAPDQSIFNEPPRSTSNRAGEGGRPPDQNRAYMNRVAPHGPTLANPVAPLPIPQCESEACYGKETPTRASAPHFVFDQVVQASMQSKVPRDALIRALEAKSLDAVPVERKWNLSEAEAAHYRALVPRALAPAKALKHAAPVSRLTETFVPENVAAELWRAWAGLSRSVGPSMTAQVADEIAFQVARGGLGRGDLVGGVRAGIALVKASRWSTPKGFHSAWRGVVMRSIQASTSRHGDAQEIGR